MTPNLLLMAKTTTTPADPHRYEDGPDKFVRKQKMMEEVLSACWDKCYCQVFSRLFPYNKWKEEHPNLSVGDGCLAKYEHKVGKADFWLCKVVEAEKGWL